MYFIGYNFFIQTKLLLPSFYRSEAGASGFPGEAPASFILSIGLKLELQDSQGKLLLPSFILSP